MKNSASRYSMRTCALDQKNQVLTGENAGFIEKWQIQNIFKRLALDPVFLPESEVEKINSKKLPRIANCLRTPYGGDVQLMKSPDKSIGHYQHLQTCGSAYGCPLCASKITEYRAREINSACESWLAADQQRTLLMITFTIPHYIFQKFETVRQSFMAMKRNFKNQNPVKSADIVPFKSLKKRYGLDHDVTAMDFTFSGRNGWHVHSHDLFFSSRALSDDQIERIQQQITDAWIYTALKPSSKLNLDSRSIENMRLHSVKVQRAKSPADYISKFGVQVFEKHRETLSQKWGIAQELSKSHLKVGRAESMTPWDFARIILYTKNDRAAYLYFGRLLSEFVQGMKGRQMIFWSKGSKRFFNLVEKSDDEIAAGSDDYAELVTMLSREDWQIVKKYDARAEVAILAGTKNAIEIKNWIRSLCHEN